LTGMNLRILDERYEESDLSGIINAIDRLKMTTREKPSDAAGHMSPAGSKPSDAAGHMSLAGSKPPDAAGSMSPAGSGSSAGSGSQNYVPARKLMDIMEIFLQSSSQHIDRIGNILEKIDTGQWNKKDQDQLNRTVKTFQKSARYVGCSDIADTLSEILVMIGKDSPWQASLEKASIEKPPVDTPDDISQILSWIKQKTEQIQIMLSDAARKREIAAKETVRASAKKELSGKPVVTESEDHFTELLGQEIKINLSKIDTFMEQILELNIAKNNLVSLEAKARNQIFGLEARAKNQIAGLEAKAQNSLANSRKEESSINGQQNGLKWLEDLKITTEQIAKISKKLQKDVLKLRLLKMSTLFDRLPGMVRRLSEQCGKSVELKLSGTDIEIDRKIIEALIDPMIHLVRNAIDHGIESAEERKSLQKDEPAMIEIAARQEGNHITIVLKDNGRGLDHEVIRKKAVEKNLVEQEQLAKMTAQEILNLIFMPGFSTSQVVTSISGRGVGLDVVNHSLHSIGGNVTLETRKGEYTKVGLTVPINMAITEVLLTELDNDVYAFPYTSIYETTLVYPDDIQIVNNRETAVYKENLLPLKALSDIMETTNNIRLRKRDKHEKIQVIVLCFGSQLMGVAVDRILHNEGVLNKPLIHHLKSIEELSSAALLGDGRIALVVNPAGIFKSAMEKRR
ncbi:MAG: chemotaxis protein CheW, partial [Desulfamplus sp.]|nr:chemotaxis protein CheW [Desulfamplus sp.]